MGRRALLTTMVALVALFAVRMSAQAPATLKVRLDGGASAQSGDATSVKAAPMGKGVHVTGGPGAIVWDPANTVKGIFSVKGTFTVTKNPEKPTYYGLAFAATDLEGYTPAYVYFTISQDGTFQIRHRAGNEVHDMDKSLHFAIKKPDASGKSVNTLEVQVAPTAVSYLVNGAVVDATPTRKGMNSYTEMTDGLVGIRIDDAIDVQVDGWEVKAPFQLNDRGQ